MLNNKFVLFFIISLLCSQEFDPETGDLIQKKFDPKTGELIKQGVTVEKSETKLNTLGQTLIIGKDKVAFNYSILFKFLRYSMMIRNIYFFHYR